MEEETEKGRVQKWSRPFEVAGSCAFYALIETNYCDDIASCEWVIHTAKDLGQGRGPGSMHGSSACRLSRDEQPHLSTGRGRYKATNRKCGLWGLVWG